MDLAPVLLLGLTAGGTSCAVVQGGLLAGVATRHAGCAAGEDAGDSAALRSDLAPVAGFLAGKLASHAALGAALGLAGAVLPVGASTRGAVQVAVGALVLALGLGQLGMPWLRRPAGWRLGGHDRRDRGLLSGVPAAAGAGFATVLVPCGVTVAVEALAAASGSVAAGAAVMAVFVLGTWPLFGVLGLFARRAVTAWRGRLRLVTGAALVAAGGWTAVGGLAAAGVVVPRATVDRPLSVGGAVVSVADGHQTVVVTVRSNGFDPADVTVRAGVPTALVLRARNATGCIRTVVIAGRDGEWVLPADGDVRIDLGVRARGLVRYSCVMGMYTARLTFR
ncbi:urease accessory protein UreH domain-containing protein [Dactylosporangium sp. CA-233914]|uniref:urease accessory protein UreH domain-containing protein n=1 Tax=Dactylosporangium sp. CA-233914 TaxID=3239934 RepID=UPI003D8FE657